MRLKKGNMVIFGWEDGGNNIGLLFEKRKLEGFKRCWEIYVLDSEFEYANIPFNSHHKSRRYFIMREWIKQVIK